MLDWQFACMDGKHHKVRTYKEYHSVCPSSELGLSQPLSSQRVFPSPQKQGGGGTLACGWGVGGSPNSDEGHTLWYSLYVRTLWKTPKQIRSRNYILRGIFFVCALCIGAFNYRRHFYTNNIHKEIWVKFIHLLLPQGLRMSHWKA